MNGARAAAIERGLTNISRKVLEASSPDEPLTVAQIMRNLPPGNYELRIVSGCLNSLAAQKLVHEEPDGRWIRVVRAPRVALVVPSTKEEEMPVAAPAPAPTPTPTHADLVVRAANIIEKLHAIGDEIETLALDADAALQQLNAKLEKMRQLQQLLKDFGD